VIPDLAALDLPGLVTRAGDPGTRGISATSWLLSLLALKLTPPGGCPTPMTGWQTPPPACWPGLGPAQEVGADQLLLPALARHQPNFLAAWTPR
jgi:hypothetical protein